MISAHIEIRRTFVSELAEFNNVYKFLEVEETIRQLCGALMWTVGTVVNSAVHNHISDYATRVTDEDKTTFGDFRNTG